MLTELHTGDVADFTFACGFEHVFGSKALTALRAYGFGGEARFFLCREEAGPTAALYLKDGVLVVSAAEDCDPAPIAELVRQSGVGEVDTNFDQCARLHTLLGGTVESSHYMVYQGERIEGDFSDLEPGDLSQVFDVLQRSHEYYRTHLVYETWAGDLRRRLEQGLTELYQLRADGQVVGTGSILSEDEECGVLAAVAVLPEYRHRGLGAHISRFLTRRVLEKGKTPRLISGYDAVAELYRQVGYQPCGRWGELYLVRAE